MYNVIINVHMLSNNNHLRLTYHNNVLTLAKWKLETPSKGRHQNSLRLTQSVILADVS